MPVGENGLASPLTNAWSAVLFRSVPPFSCEKQHIKFWVNPKMDRWPGGRSSVFNRAQTKSTARRQYHWLSNGNSNLIKMNN